MWIPELRDVPTRFIHRPFCIPPLIEMMSPINRKNYPNEIVDFEATSQVAKERIFVYENEQMQRVSQQVFERHGSQRKSKIDENPHKGTTRCFCFLRLLSLETCLCVKRLYNHIG